MGMRYPRFYAYGELLIDDLEELSHRAIQSVSQ